MKVASPNAKVAQDAVSRSELGHDQAASAQVLDEAAEDGVGYAGHGRKHGGRSDADIPDLHRLGKRTCPCGDGRLARPPHRCIRVVPELLHDMILLSFPDETIS